MSVSVTVRAVDRVLVVLRPAPPEPALVRTPVASGATAVDLTGHEPGPTHQRLLTAGEVLASWFGASLQLVTSDDGAADHLDTLSGSIGLRTEPVTVLPAASFERDLNAHAARHAPALVVATDTEASRTLARTGAQPTLLLPPGPPRRQPSGSLLVEVTPGGAGDDAVALAAVWALALDTPLALIVDDSPEAALAADRVTARLRPMGVRLEPSVTLAAAVARFGLPDAPLALVVPAADVDRSAAARAARSAGGTLLAAPRPAAERRAPELDLAAVDDLSAALGGSVDDTGARLSPTECIELLCSGSVGRIGYVDHGWPVVTPVRYSVDPGRGEVFIQGRPGGHLAGAARLDRVCFEVDTAPSGPTAPGFGSVVSPRTRSVVLHGHVEVISDPALLQAAWTSEPAPDPAAPDEPHVWLRFVTLATTGRRAG